MAAAADLRKRLAPHPLIPPGVEGGVSVSSQLPRESELLCQFDLAITFRAIDPSSLASILAGIVVLWLGEHVAFCKL